MKPVWKKKVGEKGNAAVLFAVCLTVLLSFVSLVTDFGVVGMKRARMMDLCQQIKTARLDAGDYIMNSSNPAKMIYDIGNQCAIDSGFTGNLKVYYKEVTSPVSPSGEWVDKRIYKVRIELMQTHRFSYPANLILGTGDRPITVFLDGGEQKSSAAAGGTLTIPVWYPRGTLRNGSYERSDLTGASPPIYMANNYPMGW